MHTNNGISHLKYRVFGPFWAILVMANCKFYKRRNMKSSMCLCWLVVHFVASRQYIWAVQMEWKCNSVHTYIVNGNV
jgi:hypothetical protein